MGNIKDLTGPGSKFKATGPYSFKRQLKKATMRGELGNLKDNTAAITEAISGYKNVIKVRGGLTPLQKKKISKQIRKEDHHLLKGDRKDIKKILEYLGRTKKNKQNVLKGSPTKTAPMSEDRKKQNIESQRETTQYIEKKLAELGRPITSSFGLSQERNKFKPQY